MYTFYILLVSIFINLFFFLDVTFSSVSAQPAQYCAKKNIGDADCKSDASGKSVTILDNAIWYSEFIGNCSDSNVSLCGNDTDNNGQAMDANFNYAGTSYILTDNKVDVFDYAIWIQGFLADKGNSGGLTPTLSQAPTTIPNPSPTKVNSSNWWKPTPDKPIHWHWQLSQEFVFPRDVVPGATVYDIDGEYATAETVAELHALGPDIKVICYFDAGVFEDYRSDAHKFPESVIGKVDVGWDGSYWLDVRQTDILLPIMRDRMVNWCKNKGFDAIEPDETEVWSNNSGFSITKEQNNFYNRKIAEMAHELGLSVGLKGNTTEALDLWPYFDWTLNEECWQYDECDILKRSFIDNGKAVLNIEYQKNPNCTQANQWRMNSAKRDLNLMSPTHSSYRYSPCVPNTQNSW